MAILTPAREEIYAEETAYKASISELTMQKMGASINYILQNGNSQIGDIVHSALTEAQFQALRGNNWVLMSGQSIVGSDLAILTGITTLPDAATNGAFIGQQTGTMLDYEDSENKSHSHRMFSGLSGDTSYPLSSYPDLYACQNRFSGSDSFNYIMTGNSTNTAPTKGKSGLDGETAAQPNTVRANIFIKINENPT
jgi:hypothetical protein